MSDRRYLNSLKLESLRTAKRRHQRDRKCAWHGPKCFLTASWWEWEGQTIMSLKSPFLTRLGTPIEWCQPTSDTVHLQMPIARCVGWRIYFLKRQFWRNFPKRLKMQNAFVPTMSESDNGIRLVLATLQKKAMAMRKVSNSSYSTV